MDKRYFSEKLVKWYQENKRELPWRNTRQPYKIWLSEIILQQTRVNQGLPYYNRFLEQYPTLRVLARAPEQEVLRLWQGLGYYSRARNLLKCARVVTQQYKGRFPTSYQSLLALPGIGEYTAAAIASFSVKEPVAVVDGNVYRVLARIYGLDTPVNSPEGKKLFSQLANELLSRKHPDLHNQAMMEFGAVHCTPKNPACDSCVFSKQCQAARLELQPVLPVKVKTRPPRKRYFYYLVFENKKSLLMRKRLPGDIWNGLYDFTLVEKNRAVSPQAIIQMELPEQVSGMREISVSKVYRHQLSHQSIQCRFITIKSGIAGPVASGYDFYTLKQIERLPKPVLVSRFLAEHYPV